ncbi:hypothetical protein PIB30_081769 [Stylosanthes scabra]|uniref:Uncharacterized protein n=1 Tax=Stylosanthes scabra TaxID=79078 RepID=A0ABU6QU81_9FABA|nr:hypothetical protein [Stylosanthes scabra]
MWGKYVPPPSNFTLRCIELYVKVEDVISSASSKACPQVVRSDNIGRGAKRVLSPVIPPRVLSPVIPPSPANTASKDVAVDKLCLPLKTMNTGGACGVFTPPTAYGVFTPPTSKKPDTSANIGFPPPLKMQKMVGGNGKPTETGVLVPDIEESNVYSNHFQANGMSRKLEPPITSNSQKSKENRVKKLEIRFESKENERAALEELKVTLTSKISNLENKLKEANKEKASQLRKERTASKRIIERLEAEVNDLGCDLIDEKERARSNIMEQVRLLAPGIDFSRVHPDYQVVNGEIVNPKKKDPEPHFTLQIGGKGQPHPILHPWPQAKDRTQGNIMEC